MICSTWGMLLMCRERCSAGDLCTTNRQHIKNDDDVMYCRLYGSPAPAQATTRGPGRDPLEAGRRWRKVGAGGGWEGGARRRCCH